jgi:hypothetical protein
MIDRLTDYILALCDLIEAGGRALQRAFRHAALGVLLLSLAGLLLATGFGFLIAGLYLGLAAAINPWAGALITGGIVVVAGALATWIAVQTIR